jgi:hypothetical protein
LLEVSDSGLVPLWTGIQTFSSNLYRKKPHGYLRAKREYIRDPAFLFYNPNLSPYHLPSVVPVIDLVMGQQTTHSMWRTLSVSLDALMVK